MPEMDPAVSYGKLPFIAATTVRLVFDGKGHVLLKNQPLAICDKTAQALKI
jgi:hypothetical protein